MNFNDQKGVVSVVPLLLIISLVGVITFLLLASIGPFKGGFDNLFSKDASKAATQTFYKQYTIGTGNIPAEMKIMGALSSSTNGQKLAVVDYGHSRVLIYNTIPTNGDAVPDVVVGQVDMAHAGANQGGSVGPNTVAFSANYFGGVLLINNKLIIADADNHRVLIFNSIPTTNNASADVVIGQPDFTHNVRNQTPGGLAGANTLSSPYDVASDGTKLFITDLGSNRVLIYNSIPTTNNAPANVVIGQPDFTHSNTNQGGAVGANNLNTPGQLIVIGGKLLIPDIHNNRVLIYNSIPTTNNAPANVVIGQVDFTHNSGNQGLITPTAYSLYSPFALATNGTSLYIGDNNNVRIQIFDTIPSINNASADGTISQVNWINKLNYYGGLLYGSDITAGVEVYGQAQITPTPSPTAGPGCPRGPLGDIDCDGDIDIFDFNILVTNFGK